LEKIKLFCFPYAGGSSMVYTKWKKFLGNIVDIEPMELAGRGKRMIEPLNNSLDEVVNDLYEKIIEKINVDTVYTMFGHSMGSTIAYELFYKLKENNKTLPVHMFFSGRFPPYISKQTNYHKLPDEEFINSLKRLGGIDSTFTSNKELMDLFLPIIKSDYKMVEEYVYKEKKGAINCNITILNGKRDSITNDVDMKKWCDCTNKNCKMYEFDSDHFFINSHMDDVLQIIQKTLLLI
jgi:surfactin synthase thioesterase subunit